MTADIIQLFPREETPDPFEDVPREPEVHLDSKLMLRAHCEEVVKFCMERSCEEIGLQGITATGDMAEHKLDVMLLEEAMRSFIFRMVGLDHPMHGMASIVLEEIRARRA